MAFMLSEVCHRVHKSLLLHDSSHHSDIIRTVYLEEVGLSLVVALKLSDVMHIKCQELAAVLKCNVCHGIGM